MISIRRNNCPPSLQKPDHDFVMGDYNNDDVKDALLAMQHSKCCYCERKLSELGITEREVEHYMPKSSLKNGVGNIQWHLANRWENLLYVCRSCNSRKGSKNPFNEETREREIIDPSVDGFDPEDHIDFDIDGVFITFKAKKESQLGQSTIGKLKLAERKDILGRLRKIKAEIEIEFINLINALEIDSVTESTALENQLSRAMSAHESFAAFKRNFIEKRLRKLNEAEIPRLESEGGRRLHRIEIEFPRQHEVVM